MEPMRELTELSLQLNSESNSINSTINAINEKLRTLNVGVETWLDEPLVKQLPGDGPRNEAGPFLGYCCIDEKWQLAVRGTLKDSAFGEPVYDRTSPNPNSKLPRNPLTNAPREIRITAVQQIPLLIVQIKNEAANVLKAIRDAKGLAQSLTMNKNDILATVLKTLAARYLEGNKHRATFAPTTPEESQSLREVLASLRAEGSIDELANTYQFTASGYKKFQSQIEWLKIVGEL